METPGLTLLVIQLMAALHGLTGHPVPADAPRVEFVPQAGLAEMACGGPCGIRGWYGGERVIFLDDRLTPEENFWDRGILVHELVHYMQEQAGAYGITPTCERWLKRERDAYDAQRRWLTENRPAGKRLEYARFRRLFVECDP